jgi:cobyric acid synthase
MGEVTGYEIHMGITESGCDREALEGDGRVSDDGLVFGTYLHGLFSNPSAANALLSYLYSQKGLPFIPITDDEGDPYENQLIMLVKEWNPSPWRSAHFTASAFDRSTRSVVRHFVQ